VRGTARDSLPGRALPNLATVASMKDVRGEIREFLTTRRAKLTPEQAGLPRYGGRRRVTGLRRDEVAQLAGISIEYYTRLERGNIRGASDEVLDGIARALQLNEVERAHLTDLVRLASASPAARYQPARQQVRPSVQRLLDSMTHTAAFLRNGRLDILAANSLGRALYSPVFGSPVSGNPRRPANIARFIFLDERSAQFYRDWDGIARQAVGSLHAETGRWPAWSASCPSAASSSGNYGPATTWCTTAAASSRSTTRKPATSTWTTTPWRSPPIPARPSSPTAPSQARPRATRSTSSPAGPPHSTRTASRK